MPKKADVFFIVCHFHPSLAGKAGAYQSGVYYQGRVIILAENIRPGPNVIKLFCP
jgi:hypothetical protein